jgi:hypothetical protein
MWDRVFSVKLERAHLVQSGSVADRGVDASTVDQARYRKNGAVFNEKCNHDQPSVKPTLRPCRQEQHHSCRPVTLQQLPRSASPR